MKKIVCELCDGTVFTKVDGMFVCSGCGTQYSIEEAKNMMKDVDEDDAPESETLVNSTKPKDTQKQQELDNLLLLATTAYDAGNKSEAEKFCNQALVLDATCYKAWFLKGKVVGWSSTISKNRFEEAAHSFAQAIDFAPEDEKEDIINQAQEEFKELGLAIMRVRKKKICPIS